jgi:predicted RNA binding protein YcfA (HicA-like mRNA interferase family)
MPKLPSITSKEVIRALERLGFEKVRTKGSHVIFKKDGLTVPVPFHNKDLKKGTLRSILNLAKISVEDLLNKL